MSFTYLVTFGSNKKKICIPVRDKEIFLEEFIKTFNVDPNNCNFLIQKYDQEFEDYEDLENFEDAADKVKLQVIRQETQTQVKEHEFSDTCEHLFDSQDEAMNIQETMKGHSEDNGISFPIPYQLPVFPPQVTRALNSNTLEDVARTPRLRNLIVSTIVDDIKRYGNGYLLSREYREVCSVLITKYPQLSDRRLDANAGVCNVLPYGTWLNSIRGRIKYIRQKQLLPNKVANDMRQKYGHKPKGQAEFTLAVRNESRFLKMNPIECTTEDERSIDHHKTTIMKESSRRTPDANLIEDRMVRTLNDRRLLYEKPIGVVLQEYPILSDCHQIVQECKRIFNIDPTESRKKFFNDKAKFDVMKEKINASAKAKDVLASVNGNENDAWLLLLPVLFKEKVDEFVIVDKTTNIVHPTLRISTGDGTIANPEMCDVFIDNEIVCSCPELGIGLDAVVSAAYLWNIKFNPKLIKTYRFLAEVVCGFPSEKSLPTSVIRLTNCFL